MSVPSQGIERSCICVVGVSPFPLSKKCLKRYAEVVIWRRSGNTMIYNTLHNTKDCATRTPLNPGLNSGAPEGSEFLTAVVLLLFVTNIIQLMTFDEVNTRIDQPMEHDIRDIHRGIRCEYHVPWVDQSLYSPKLKFINCFTIWH